MGKQADKQAGRQTHRTTATRGSGRAYLCATLTSFDAIPLPCNVASSTRHTLGSIVYTAYLALGFVNPTHASPECTNQ